MPGRETLPIYVQSAMPASDTFTVGRLRPALYRWEYRRANALVACELCVTAGPKRYFVTVCHENDGWPSRDEFSELLAAVQRHAAIEKALIETGWSLSDYRRAESTQPRALRTPSVRRRCSGQLRLLPGEHEKL